MLAVLPRAEKFELVLALQVHPVNPPALHIVQAERNELFVADSDDDFDTAAATPYKGLLDLHADFELLPRSTTDEATVYVPLEAGRTLREEVCALFIVVAVDFAKGEAVRVLHFVEGSTSLMVAAC